MVLAVTCWLLDGKRRARAEARANEAVAEHVATHEGHLAHQEWGPAIEQLQQAVAIPHASDLATARALLDEAKRRRAAAVLAEIETRLPHIDPREGFRLLDRYLADTDAFEKDRARQLWADLELATSDDHAKVLLKELSDEALAKLAPTDGLPDLNRVSHLGLRAIYHETLARNARYEVERRAELQRQGEEARLADQRRRQATQAKRDARIRATPVFRELSDFVERTRRTHKGQEPSAEEVRLQLYVVRQLKIRDPIQKQQLFEETPDQPDTRRQLQAQISRLRAAVKERFRGLAYREFDQGDKEVFDQAVDRELDQLVSELKLH